MPLLSHDLLPAAIGDFRILIVEDEVIARTALASLLTAKGYVTSAVGSAEAAIDLMRSGEHHEVALVDLDLPGMNGADLIGKMSHDQPNLFPILITAAAKERVSRALHGPVTHLRKPLDFGELLSILGSRERPRV